MITLAYVIISVAALWFLWSWSKSQNKRRGDQNELDVLEETIQEHELGRHDNTDYIKKQIFFIERDHNLTPEVQRLLERARSAIQDDD
jgi:flagellar basal body-associated protein FliL